LNSSCSSALALYEHSHRERLISRYFTENPFHYCQPYLADMRSYQFSVTVSFINVNAL
jgi:hypothetical protein